MPQLPQTLSELFRAERAGAVWSEAEDFDVEDLELDVNHELLMLVVTQNKNDYFWSDLEKSQS